MYYFFLGVTVFVLLFHFCWLHLRLVVVVEVVVEVEDIAASTIALSTNLVLLASPTISRSSRRSSIRHCRLHNCHVPCGGGGAGRDLKFLTNDE